MRSLYAEGAPPMLRMAVVVQGLEALGVTAVAVAQVVEVATGHAYQASSGIALAVLELIVAVGLALIARGMAKLRPWTRTPGIMTQICCALLGIILLQAQRPDFGIPALVLAIAGLVTMFHPASLRALRRSFGDAEDAAPAQGGAQSSTGQSGTSKAGAAKSGTAKSGTSKAGAAKSGTTAEAGPPQGGTSKGGTSKAGAAKGGTAKGGGAKSAKGASGQPRSSARRTSGSGKR